MMGLKVEKMSRGQAVARRFGVAENSPRADWRRQVETAAVELLASCRPGTIVLLRGTSGSGKSMLLRELSSRLGLRAVSCDDARLAGRLVVDCLAWLELEKALEVLARFGLGEVQAYLAQTQHLSTGQRSRLQLAVGYARAMTGRDRILLADEFATQLDRFSAAVLARNLRRVLDADSAAGAVVATCHDDLEKALRPDVVVDCDFGVYHISRRGSDAI